MLNKVSFWKAITFSLIALIVALVIGYAVYAGNEAFPEGEPIYEESVSGTLDQNQE